MDRFLHLDNSDLLVSPLSYAHTVLYALSVKNVVATEHLLFTVKNVSKIIERKAHFILLLF